jgi:spore germination protein (amino acid permease)
MISRAQFYLLTVNFMLGTTLFVTINKMIMVGSRDAWMIPLWAGAYGSLAALLWILLLRTSPGSSPIQIAREAWGRPGGFLVAVLYLFYFCMLSGWVLRNLSDFMNVTIMPETPKTMFHVMFLLVACYAVANGAETVGRLNAIVTPFLVFPFWSSLMLATVNWNWERLQPAFQDPLAILRFHSHLGFPFMETFSLMMLYPLVHSGAARALLLGVASAALSISLVVFMSIGLLGAERAARISYPIYTIVQEVDLGTVIVNVHSVLTVILIILIFIKLLVLLYAASETIHQMFRPASRWPHLLALTMLCSAVAIAVYENPIQNMDWSAAYTFVYDSFFTILIPSLMLATVWLKRVFRKHG